MSRTRNRPLPAGRLPSGEALLMGLLLAFGGVLYLSWAVNIPTGILSGLTVAIYLYIYTPLKKISAICTTVGAVAGALPPVIGWTAATGRLDVEVWTLFAILFFWQFPHFLSLAWMYKDDFARAGLHVLPWIQSKDGISSPTATSISIVINTVGLLVASLFPTILGLTGFSYLCLALVFGLIMTTSSLQFLWDPTRGKARSLFFASLIYIPVLVLTMVLNRVPV